MDILGPDFLRIAFDIALVLAAMSAVVLGVIVLVRLAAQSETLRAERFRRRAEPAVTAYLAGRDNAGKVVPILQEHPALALNLLMEISDRLPPAERPTLETLFTSLPLRAQESAALHSRRWERRLQAAGRLGYLGDGVSVPALLDALQDPVLAVRFAAARSLAALGQTPTIRNIMLAFDLPGEMNQRRVVEVLVLFGPAAAAPLLEILENDDGTYSDNAVDVATRVLGLLRIDEAVEPITALLAHSEFRVRLNAVRSLGLIGDHGSAEAVARLAGDPAWEVRNVVMQSLGRMRSVRHTGLVADALRDSSWWVRFSAAQALWNLGTEGREALHAAMTGSPDRFAREMSRQVLEENGTLAAREATL